MRLKINFTKNTKSVPVNNQHIVNSFVHRCLGKDNKYHDSKSDYCVSYLLGGKLNEDKTLSFPNNPYIIISSNNDKFINDLLVGVSSNVEMGFGMELENIEYISEDFYNGYNIFRTLTPILLKEFIDYENYEFITVNDSDFEKKLQTNTINKLKSINSDLDLSNFRIKVNKHKRNKTKLITLKGVKNIASHCDIIVYSNKEIAEILHNTGLGNSTGSGFGTIYNSKNKSDYAF